MRTESELRRSDPGVSPARIVLAEDDAQMRHLVAESLRADGHRVMELVDGGQLLVRIARQYRAADPTEPIDLIVSDIRMPVITGLAILKGLRDAHCSTPVILMTAFGDDATRRDAADLGGALLDKPFRMTELRALARKLLDREQWMHSPERGASNTPSDAPSRGRGERSSR